jgi:hypothetical protein
MFNGGYGLRHEGSKTGKFISDDDTMMHPCRSIILSDPISSQTVYGYSQTISPLHALCVRMSGCDALLAKDQRVSRSNESIETY